MHEESRDMWRVYLDQQDYKSAFRHCRTQVQHTAQQPFVFNSRWLYTLYIQLLHTVAQSWHAQLSSLFNLDSDSGLQACA